jgi:hypothetical protein
MHVLDVAIGLVFVYLISNLACIAANELIAPWSNARGKTLKEGIRAYAPPAALPPARGA